jgi:hypothetical protein
VQQNEPGGFKTLASNLAPVMLARSPAEAPARPDINGGEPVLSFVPLSTSENKLELAVVVSPSPEGVSTDAAAAKSAGQVPTPGPKDQEEGRPPGTSWPLLLLASYASAVTMALFWLLWTGRGLDRPGPTFESGWETGPLDSGKDRRPGRAGLVPPVPSQNLTTLGTAVRLGDLEVTPRHISRREIELVRLDGATGETRQVGDVLVLSLRFTNRSKDQVLIPLVPAFVRDSNPTDDRSYIETQTGREIAMYRLAPESEWSIKDQRFPTLRPGERGQTIVVSETVRMSDLAGSLTWRVKLRTGTYQTDVLGIHFSAENVIDESF